MGKIQVKYDCKHMNCTCMNGRMVRLECNSSCKQYVQKPEWSMPDYDDIIKHYEAEKAKLEIQMRERAEQDEARIKELTMELDLKNKKKDAKK